MVCNGISEFSIEYYAIAICSCVSLVGSLCIILLYCRYPSLRGHFNTIVIYISTADVIRSSFLIIPCEILPSETAKAIVGSILNSTLITTIIWSAYISITLYRVITSSLDNLENRHKVWLFISIIVIPVYFLPIFTDSYSIKVLICALNDNHQGELWGIAIIVVPSTLLTLVSVFAYLKSYSIIITMPISPRKKQMLKTIGLYPVIMIFDIIPMLVSSVIEYFHSGCKMNLFYSMSLGVYALHGLFNAVIFSLNNLIKKRISTGNSLRKVSSSEYSSYPTSNFGSHNFLEESYHTLGD